MFRKDFWNVGRLYQTTRRSNPWELQSHREGSQLKIVGRISSFIHRISTSVVALNFPVIEVPTPYFRFYDVFMVQLMVCIAFIDKTMHERMCGMRGNPWSGLRCRPSIRARRLYKLAEIHGAVSLSSSRSRIYSEVTPPSTGPEILLP
jgi:hypothetical protein